MMHQEPTIANILRHLAAEHDGPVEERRVLEQVLERRPSSAKNPFATIRERLRWDGLTLGWLRLNRRQLVPLRVVLDGLRFRCIPRTRDIAEGLLPLAHLQPFAGLRGADVLVQDLAGRPMTLLEPDDDERGHGLSMPSFELRDWYARTGFQAGDSIMVTVTGSDPLLLRIEREPAVEFRRSLVAAQDAELLDAIVERVNRANVALIPCDEVVLPIFAAAAWRGGYPGSPWQLLVTRDGRLQLVDDIFLTNQRHSTLRLFSADEVFEPLPTSEPDRQAEEMALLSEIDLLQRDLQHARDGDVAAGIWDGQMQRASAAHSSIERFSDDGRSLGGLDGLLTNLDGSWDDDDDDDFLELDGSLADVSRELDAARARMLAALPPDAVARLEHARPEEAEVIIAQHLNMLLVREPSLFPRIDLTPVSQGDLASDPSADALPDEAWELAWDDDDDEWVDDLDDELDEIEDDRIYSRSGDLIAQFHDYLTEIGKSEATARARARGLHPYAEFLASYYGRTLAEGDYATLDECLFFYYPRRVMNTSARQVREICTAVKQFYLFLKQRGEIDDERFAEALWRRRDQAARVVEIYDRITSDSPNFELLFDRLFRPYTE